MTNTRLVGATLALAFAAGCTGIQGPPQVINSGGLLPRALGGSLEARFETAAIAALSDGATAREQERFVRTGTLLVMPVATTSSSVQGAIKAAPGWGETSWRR